MLTDFDCDGKRVLTPPFTKRSPCAKPGELELAPRLVNALLLTRRLRMLVLTLITPMSKLASSGPLSTIGIVGPPDSVTNMVRLPPRAAPTPNANSPTPHRRQRTRGT